MSPLRKRRTSFLSILLLVGLCLIAIEGASYLAHRVLFKTPYSAENTQAQAEHVLGRMFSEGKDGINEWTGSIVPHPYVGYAYAPDSLTPKDGRTQKNFDKSQCFINPQGFITSGAPAPFAKDASNDKTQTVDIVIAGASVVTQFLCHEGPKLIKFFEGTSYFKGKNVRITAAAVGAWRQPQPLTALSYFYSLGLKPAMILSLDGFNEAANPYLYPDKNLYPSYPFYWKQLNEGAVTSPEEIGIIYAARQQQAFWARLAKKFYKSAFVGTLFELMNNRLEKKIVEASKTEQRETQPYNFTHDGPKFNAENVGKISVNIWKQASLQMLALAKENDALYVHFLQPALTLEGSKDTLSQDEKNNAALPSHARHGVPINYPVMQSFGAEINRKGGHFFDLTGIFKHVKEQVYIDPCHLTDEGYDLMFEQMTKDMEPLLK